MRPQSGAISRRVEIAFTGLRKVIVASLFSFFSPVYISSLNWQLECQVIWSKVSILHLNFKRSTVIVFIVDFWDGETEIRGSIYVE